jgi:hypothetical protein
MVRNVVLGSVLVGVFVTASAANWQSIYTGADGTIWVDRSTLSQEYRMIDARLRIKPTKPLNPGDVTYDERYVNVNLTIYCDSWHYSLTSDSKWLHGKLTKEWKGQTEYLQIDADKPLSEAAKALCGKSYGSVRTREPAQG